MNYGKAIRIIRVSRNLSQTQLGERTGLDASYISRIEAGQRKASLETLEACAKELQIPVFLLVLAASSRDDLKGLPTEIIQPIAVTFLEILLASPDDQESGYEARKG